jgi:hypothetical protein
LPARIAFAKPLRRSEAEGTQAWNLLPVYLQQAGHGMVSLQKNI